MYTIPRWYGLALNTLALSRVCDPQTVGVARPSDFDEHVAAASMLPRADELMKPVQEALE